MIKRKYDTIITFEQSPIRITKLITLVIIMIQVKIVVINLVQSWNLHLQLSFPEGINGLLTVSVLANLKLNGQSLCWLRIGKTGHRGQHAQRHVVVDRWPDTRIAWKERGLLSDCTNQRDLSMSWIVSNFMIFPLWKRIARERELKES